MESAGTGGAEALTWEERVVGLGSAVLTLLRTLCGIRDNQVVAQQRTVCIWLLVQVSLDMMLGVLMIEHSYVRESEFSKTKYTCHKLCFIHFAHVFTIEKFGALLSLIS